MKIIAPSLLAADFSNLELAMDNLNNSKAQWLHIDVMDGQFVPNITFGSKVISTIRKKSDMFFDVHMMVKNPSKLIEQLAHAGADQITVHIEACDHLHTTIKKIKSLGVKVGLTLKPTTKISALTEYLQQVDHVLLMSVEPGFGGQEFLPESVERLKELVKLRKDLDLKFTIGVDGGITCDNIRVMATLGADVLVMGTAVFKNGKVKNNIDLFHSFIN